MSEKSEVLASTARDYRSMAGIALVTAVLIPAVYLSRGDSIAVDVSLTQFIQNIFSQNYGWAHAVSGLAALPYYVLMVAVGALSVHCVPQISK